MDRKKLFPILIITPFIVDLIFGQLMYHLYLNSGEPLTDSEYGLYVILTMFSTFLLTNTFYVLILIFFRDNKSLTNFAALLIIVNFCFAGYVSLGNYFAFETIIIKLYAGVSYFFSFVAIITATSIILQEIHSKIVSVSLLYFSIVTFIFGTLVSDYVRGYLVGFFGATPDTVTTVFLIYDIFLIVLRLSVIILQVLAIRTLIDVQAGHKRVVRQLY